METKGGPDIVCEPDDPPCTKELASATGTGMRFGKFKPRCHANGFYHHTQCRGSVCWCTDRCGNQIPSSKHSIGTRGVCECPNDDYAWKCTTNPCDLETTRCPAHPDAVCKPSMCGGCVAKFYVEDKEVECALPDPETLQSQCTDYNGNKHEPDERWKMDKCTQCECMDGEAVCMSPSCAGPPMRWEYCLVKPGMEDVCCPDFDCIGCLDSDGRTHYDVGETWSEGGPSSCNLCTCNDNNNVSCVRELCPGVNRYIPPLCRWVIRTGECCPRDDSQNGIVCDEPISACEPGSVVMQDCPSDLCLTATCDGHPDATCKISHCGTCHTVFYDGDGAKVACQNEAVVMEALCSGSMTTCIVSPCDAGAVCRDYPEAACHVELCNQCDPLFFNERNEPLVCGEIREMCDETHAVGDHWEETCMTCECHQSALIACIPHECGLAPPLPVRCRWAKRTPDECCPSKMVCEEPLSDCPFSASVASSCPDDLCDTTCEGHPNATCLISRCGGCSAKFFDQNNQTVQCEGGTLQVEPKCPTDVPVLTCFASPCDVKTCDHYRFPDAVCHVDYCQPCTAVFHCPCNNLLDCEEKGKKDTIECKDSSNNKHDLGETWLEGCNECTCEETGIPTCRAKTCDAALNLATCEGGHRVGEIWEGSCMTCECSPSLTPVCIPHECGRAPPIPDRCYLAKQTPDECCPSKVVCEEALSLCREGTAVAPSCPDDLCDATCEGHPDATCLISRCGGCEARYFDESGQRVPCGQGLIVSQPVCPEDTPPVTCLIVFCELHPCVNYPDAVCHIDYCRPCEIVYYDELNQKIDCSVETKVDEIECKDSSNNKHDEGETWMEGCNECTCEATGIPSCRAKTCDTATCEGGQRVGEMWEESCMTCECAPSLTPVCIAHECGLAPPIPDRCHLAKQTPDECCPSKVVCEEALSLCREGTAVAPSCPDDLCDATCEGHPDATCLISRCGGCEARYFDESGQRVPCGQGLIVIQPVCPEDTPPVTCLIVFCEQSPCENYPDAVCHIDYCRPCEIVYYDELNQKIDCSVQTKVDEIECKDSSNNKHDEGETWMEGCNECTCEATGIPVCRAKTCDTATCEGGHRVGEMWEGSCMTCECSPSLTPVCIPHECGLAPPIPDRCHLAKQTPDECCPSKVVCEEALSLCREGTAVAPSCPDDLCDATCEGHPDATCLISRCGGCEARYFDESGQRVRCGQGLIVSQPVCPEDTPPVTCLIVFCEQSPCENYPDAVCHIDYCQPCKIVYYDELNQKIDCSVETKLDKIECKDSSNNKHDEGETWMEGCNECTCEATGIPACRAKTCDTDPMPQCNPDEYQESPRGVQTLHRCLKNGQFSPKQCDTSGHCWCANPDGSVATEQFDVPTGKELVCVSEPPCHRELLNNKHKTERGEVVTSDPVCSSTGWYEPAQCSPATGECWCSERDGTVVIGSIRRQGEPLDCNAQCLGDASNIVASIVCSKQYNGCPSDAFCHIPPNHTKGKCCYLPSRAMP
ncbi:kielin/chordin-like protein isoform X3 [Patiria miniata]|nr:kielin/chordin-like protein isoform X3 [Patiria miniata]